MGCLASKDTEDVPEQQSNADQNPLAKRPTTRSSVPAPALTSKEVIHEPPVVTQGLPEQDLEQVQVSSQKQEDGLAATAQSGWDKLEQWVAEVESHRETMHKYPATTLGQIEGDTLSNASKKDMSIASMSISTAEQNISTVQSTVCSTGGSSHVRCSSRGAPSTPGPSAAEFPLKLVDCDEASEVSTPKPVTTDSQSPWENSLDKE